MAFLIDPKRSFDELTKTVLDNVVSTFPIESDKRTLRVSNVKVDTSKVDPYDFRAQKEVKAREGDYVAPVTGDMELVDKETGAVIDSRKGMRLMDVPMITARHSFLLGGNEYTVDRQLRLKPGIFTREKENGELESTFNLAKGGRGFKMLLNPEDNIFKLKIQNANPDLYPILQALNVPDSAMQKAWGDKLFAVNKTRGDKNPAKSVVRAYKSIFGKDPLNEGAAIEELKGFFAGTVLSEETTLKTLGKGFASVTPEALVATSHKLLKVSRGEEEADDRDSLVYKHLYDTPDLVGARMESSKKKIGRDVSRMMNRRDKISELFSKDLLNKPVRAFFVQGTVSSASDQQNPVTMLSHATSVTSMGEGGIGDDNAITDSMRMVNPSHAGVLDPIHSPESERIGINLNLALGSSVHNKELQNLVVDTKTNKSSWVPIKDLYDKNLAFSDQHDAQGKAKHALSKVIVKGKMLDIPSADVDYRIKSPAQMFSFSSNLMPFLGSIQGNRGMMGNKMLGNALPLVNREVPLVQVKAPTGGSFENFVGNMFATMSNVDGTVSSITPEEIVVKTSSGPKTFQIYDNFPLNGKAFIHSYPKVKVGDKVHSGSLLADTNGTKEGTLAIGTNLRVAYTPYRAGTFEDGYVISESATKKLTSEHLRKVEAGVGRDDVLSLKAFKAHYPTALTAANAKKLDDKGIIKVGETVEPGDVMIAHLQHMEILPEDAKLGKLSKRLIKGMRNAAQIWDKDTVGKVTDIVTNPDGIKVYVRTEEPMTLGDKLVGRYGSKGIVSLILPDHEMPKDKSGKPVEVMVSPQAMPGRINPAQIYETALSKVADKLGKPMKVTNFSDVDSAEEIGRLLKEHGLTDKEELLDPTTGHSMGPIMVGKQYFLKLDHQVAKKVNARGNGPGYDIDLQPTKGGHQSARALDRLTWQALVAHGARENMFEMTAYKAEQNPELWRAIQMGYPLPAPKTPFVFNKLMGYLAAGGINVKKDGNQLHLIPLVDKEILAKSSGAINEAKVLVGKNLRAVVDGLFDDTKTGGLKGTKWSHIELAEPIPNPVMEGSIKSVLGLTQDKFDKIVGGELYFHDGKLGTEEVGTTAGAALKQMIGKIDVDKRWAELSKQSVTAKGQKLDAINKELRALRGLKANGINPVDAMLIHNVPVVPPVFRPVFPLPNGALNTSPLNFLYRDIVMVNRQLKEMKDLPDSIKKGLRADTYKAVAALQGLGDPLVERGDKKIKGAIDLIKGPSPKEGFFQSTVFSKNQDLSGSSTVTPSVEMDMDEIMLPRQMAWDLYKPFALHEMIKMGYKPLDASEAIKQRTPQAGLALEKAVAGRPLWANRAPSLHKFSMIAVQPKLYNGKSIKVHPLVVSGLNMDFDGNCVDFDSTITIKLSKSALDFLTSKDYTISNPESLEEFMRTISESTLTAQLPDGSIVVNLKIGNFPRIGTPVKDKNGADVFEVPAGVSVVGCDPVTGKSGFFPVTTLTVESNCKTSEVFFGKRSVIVSDNESLAAFDHTTGELGKVSAANVGRRMSPVLKKDPAPFGTYGDRDLGWMIGAYISDGWTSGRTVGYAKSEKIKRDEFIRIMRNNHENFTVCEYVQEKETGKLGDSVKLHLNSASLAAYMHKFNCVDTAVPSDGKTSLRKTIPTNLIQNGSEEFLWGLLSGLLDGDGSMVINMVTGRPRFSARFSTSSPLLRDSFGLLCYRLGLRNSCVVTPPRGTSNESYNLTLSTVDMFYSIQNLSCIGARETEILTKWSANPPAKDDTDIIPLSDSEAALLRGQITSTSDIGLYAALKRTDSFGTRVSRQLLSKYPEFLEACIPTLYARVLAKETSWAEVTEVKDAGNRQVFDLAVTGAKVFAVNNGIVIWDTLAVFAPMSHKAVEETKNFYPSKLLENPADLRIMTTPGHDIMTGLYYLTKKGKDIKKTFSTFDEAVKAYKSKEIEANDFVTIAGVKTSVGRIMVSKIIPSDLTIPESGLLKTTIQPFLKALSKKGSIVFAKSMSDLARLSAAHNMNSSISTGLADLRTIKGPRDKLLKEINVAMAKMKTTDEKRSYLAKRLKDVDALARTHLSENPDNSLSQLFAANGKPSFDQFKQLISTSLASNDENGKIIPTTINKSYGEGLGISDYWAASYGARKGMMDRKLETAEPGYFSKQVLSVTVGQTISEHDCGTKNGVVTNTNDPVDIIGRYEAGTNQLIDDNVYNSLLKTGRTSVKLRSPLTCQSKHGMCSLCYGLRENGQGAKIGDNVGALAGQTITEPPAQGIMKTFHSGSVIGAAASQSTGFDRLKELIHIPKFLKDRASIATTTGPVTKIEDNPAGGKNLWIGDTKHLIGIRNTLNVKKGDQVNHGDILTDGPIKPQELLEHKGIEATQQYLVDNLKTTYAGMGNKMSRKILETVVRATTNRTTVKNPGNHPWFIAGEEVPLNEVLAWNRAGHSGEDIDEVLPGSELSEKVGPYTAGTVLTRDMIKALKVGGTKEVKLKKEHIKHSPSMVGVDVMAKLGRDWIAKLNTNNIERNLMSGVQEGDFSSTSSYNPTGPYVLATGFGHADKGKY